MFEVDNGSDGNCMYYAYSISLMYYLRAKNAPEMNEYIFNKLKISEEDRKQLQKLLLKKSDLSFSSIEIKMIIQPILGKATRNLAAECTKKEFISSPTSTSLYASAKYGLDFCFKKALLGDSEEINKIMNCVDITDLAPAVEYYAIKNDSYPNSKELAQLIELDEFKSEDYKKAEIYNLEYEMRMTIYSMNRVSFVVKEFNKQWAIREVELKEIELKKEKNSFSKKDWDFYKGRVLDNILSNETINYFLEKENQLLDEYKNHLQKEKTWGSEETLLVLHRELQGERLLRNSEKDSVNHVYDHEITLHIYKGGESIYPQSEIPGMILNNKSNLHWTSIIPESVFACNDQNNINDQNHQPRIFEIYEEMKIYQLPNELEKNAGDWFKLLGEHLEILNTNSNRIIKEKSITSIFQIMSEMVCRLSDNPVWKCQLSIFNNELINSAPTFLAEKQVKPNLEKKENETTTQETASSKESINIEKKPESLVLSQYANLLIFKDLTQKTYPEELIPFISEHSQSGPKVAQKLRLMYAEGVKGNDAYTPEKCRGIGQRYINYVHHNKRNFILDEVKTFIKELDEIIRQKQSSEFIAEHKPAFYY